MATLTSILAALGITSLLIVGIVVYSLSHYSELKIIIGDILKFIGFFGTWVRKTSISNELEGTLNGVVIDFNRNFSTPLLPNCKIEWVTPENQKNTLKENEAIICLSFDKKDHDLNFFNATYNFIQTALIAKTKPFIKISSAKAIDLLSTKIILKQYRREVLRTFNSKFVEVDQIVKSAFHRLEETNQNGLYSTLLLPEVFHLGEILNDKTPSQVIESEIEQFLNWFYDLATRDFEEKSILRYESANIKIGVILIAKLATFNQYGTEAYTKWAEKYASEHFNAIYLLSKGAHRNRITKEVSDILVKTKGFDKVNKNEIVKRQGVDGQQILITCICLRPDPTTIRFNAWEFVKQKFENNEKVIGIVETVCVENIFVNISGLRSSIANKDLSAAAIPDATKIFRENQELELNIIECSSESDILVLSNVDTTTDPKIFIDANLSIENPIRAVVTRVQKDRENITRGIMVRCSKPEINAFIPNSKATFSRFTDIGEKYPETTEVEIILEEFHFGFGDYIGKIYGLKNPYTGDTFNDLTVEDEVKIVIKDIQERFVIGELEEGLECRLIADEISWDAKECNTNRFKIDDELQVKVIFIDKEQKRISVSLKQFVLSPTREFFTLNENKVVEGVISRIDDSKGIFFTIEGLDREGFIHWSELVWANIYPISQNFIVGNEIKARVINYKDDYDSIQYSCKRCVPHQFNEFLAAFNDTDEVEGDIVAHYRQVAIVQITYKNLIVQAYIHKSKISGCAFINDEDLPLYLPVGYKFTFEIERINEKNSIIEVSRKAYLAELEEVELGESYTVYFTKSYSGKCYFYSDDLEGYVYCDNNQFQPGKEFDVIPITTSSKEFAISN